MKLQIKTECVSMTLVDQIIKIVKEIEVDHRIDVDSVLLQIDVEEPLACLE